MDITLIGGSRHVLIRGDYDYMYLRSIYVCTDLKGTYQYLRYIMLAGQVEYVHTP
jgi:hypothetical protein